MPKVRFKSQFKYSPDGLTNALAQAGDVLDLSEALAISAVKSGAAEWPATISAQEAPEAAQDAAGGESEAPAEEEDEQRARDNWSKAQEGGKTGPVEDKSRAPAEDKGSELNWESAEKHFHTVRSRYEELPPESGEPALEITFKPLEYRFICGERTQDLFDSMMAVE